MNCNPKLNVIGNAFLIAAGWLLLCNCQAVAQSGLRTSLERLDTNENGDIDPHEITSLARPYLERIAKTRRMSLERPYPIEKYQEAARIYYATKSGLRGERIELTGDNSIQMFGPEPDEPLIPEFGAPYIKYPYIEEDVESAARLLRRYDRNRDEHLDQSEAERVNWTQRDPFELDINEDNRLSKHELAQRNALRRQLSREASELVQKSRRVGNGIEPVERRARSRNRNSRWSRNGGNDYWLTAGLIANFDTNQNGRLEADETDEIGLPVSRIDVNRDGELTRDEVFAYVSALQDEAGEATEALPGWFYELDTDGDSQIAMKEFTATWSAEKLREFESLDLNQDGLLTESEVAQSSSMVGGTFTNSSAEVLAPYKTLISEIEVDQDLMIGDLNLEISITHSSTSFLDATLTGPDGQRIELFSGVGGGGDNFKNTVFDDQASTSIRKARAPFEGTYQPSALSRKQPSLSHFNEQNAKGVWQLVIRGTRNIRFGMLHSWSLRIKPNNRLVDQAIHSEAQATDDHESASSTGSAPNNESSPK